MALCPASIPLQDQGRLVRWLVGGLHQAPASSPSTIAPQVGTHATESAVPERGLLEWGAGLEVVVGCRPTTEVAPAPLKSRPCPVAAKAAALPTPITSYLEWASVRQRGLFGEPDVYRLGCRPH